MVDLLSDGQGDGPAEQRGRQIDRGDVPKHALAQRDAGKVVDVTAQRLFGTGAAVGIVEQETRDAPPGRVAARLAMLGAYRSQFVAEQLAADPIAQRPTEGFVLRWRARGAVPPSAGSLLGELAKGR
jgi:hypothetical protein